MGSLSLQDKCPRHLYNGNKLIINAGPGSGKTFVLIERVKYLVNKLGVSPESLLIITFTDKAAEELRDRLMHESGLHIDIIDQMQISTIHSACRVILKDYFSSGLEVIDDSDDDMEDDVDADDDSIESEALEVLENTDEMYAEDIEEIYNKDN